jgi:hypothetical protein
VVTGANDAFSGDCNGLGLVNCTAPSIPGIITCPKPGAVACSIKVCDLDAGPCTP